MIDDFTPEDRYFYLYLMTNPHTNLCGCYEISIKQISDETGYSKETVEKLLNRFTDTHKVLSYNEPTKELLLHNWSKYNWTKSPKFDKALLSEISKVKFESFRNFLDLRRQGDTVSIPYPYPMDTTVTVTVYDNTNNNCNSIVNTKDSDNLQSNTVFDSTDSSSDEEPQNEIDFLWWQKTYNDVCRDLPKMKMMTDGRKEAIRAFLQKFTDAQFEEICNRAAASDFLSGRVKGNTWKASFDFLIQPSQAVKVLEGNFDNQAPQSPQTERWN